RGGCSAHARPAGAPLPRAGRLSDVIDALDYFWNRWVVGYDLGRQLELARRAGRHLTPPVARPSRARIAMVAAAIGLLVAAVLVARRLRRRRTLSAGNARAIARGPAWTAPRLGP